MAEEEKVVYSIEVNASNAVRKLASFENAIDRVGKRMKEVFSGPFTRRQSALERFGIDESYASQYGLQSSRNFTEINRERWISDKILPMRRHLHASYMREMLAAQNAWRAGQSSPTRAGSLLLGYTPAWSEMSRAYSSYLGNLVGMRNSGARPRRSYPIIQTMLPASSGVFRESVNEVYGTDPREWTRGGSIFRNMRYWSNGLGYSGRARTTVDAEGYFSDNRYGRNNADAQENDSNWFRNGRNGFGLFGRLWRGFSQYVPRGDGGNFLRSLFSSSSGGMSILRFVGAIGAAGAALRIFTRSVQFLLSPLTQTANEVFAFYRTRNVNGGLGNGELTQMGFAGIATGGSRDANYALMNKITAERAGLFWGGSGGSMMEAASRFGVDIRGSGEGGLATSKEYLRAISKRMSELSPTGRIALATAAGLNKEQMWMVSHGTAYYDFMSSFRSPSSYLWGGMPGMGYDTYTQNFQEESQNFYLDWATFSETVKEFLGSIAEILLPAINVILEILTGIFAILNLVLKPIAMILGKILSLLNISHYTNMAMMESDVQNKNLKDYGLINGEESGLLTSSSPNVQIGSINVTTNATDPEGVAQAIGEHLNGWFAEIYNAKGAGYERCA